MKIELGSGYRIEHISPSIPPTLVREVKPGLTETYITTNRPFALIDHEFGYLPFYLIDYFVRHHQKPINILDVAGGNESICARKISERFRDAVYVTNLDKLANPAIKTANLCSILGDAENIGQYIATQSIDLVFSTHYFPFINDETYQRQLGIIDGIRNSLKEHGIAFIHELPERIRKLGAIVDVKEVDLVYPPLYIEPVNFLLVTRHPLPPEILEAANQAHRLLQPQQNIYIYLAETMQSST